MSVASAEVIESPSFRLRTQSKNMFELDTDTLQHPTLRYTSFFIALNAYLELFRSAPASAGVTSRLRMVKHEGTSAGDSKRGTNEMSSSLAAPSAPSPSPRESIHVYIGFSEDSTLAPKSIRTCVDSVSDTHQLLGVPGRALLYRTRPTESPLS
ncbi:hypothetical protein GY45DRAFT_1126731 [Cubamyces sp. BRFM 1775]|nr:hypothetical protein GY45DRAFT_1126731 [Cubamyces sp. BRFM 1775]